MPQRQGASVDVIALVDHIADFSTGIEQKKDPCDVCKEDEKPNADGDRISFVQVNHGIRDEQQSLARDPHKGGNDRADSAEAKQIPAAQPTALRFFLKLYEFMLCLYAAVDLEKCIHMGKKAKKHNEKQCGADQ